MSLAQRLRCASGVSQPTLAVRSSDQECESLFLLRNAPSYVSDGTGSAEVLG